MLGNFTFHNPTKLYFGENSLENLGKELGKYGEKVMLVYGGGSIRKNGIYDAVLAELRKAGKQTVELSGVMPNPTIEKVMEGVALARKEAVDLILAVGGGSVCDYCKAVAGSAYCEHDPWEYYFNNFGEMTCRWIPVGCVLTMAGTGSEMDSCSVISKHSENRKKFYYFRNPDFSILNPVYTYTVPRHHTVAGIYDIMSHILEQYLSGTDDNTTDYIAEGLMRSLVVSSRKVLGNPEDYEARSNIKTLYRILDDRVEALEFTVHEESAATGVPLSQLHLKKNLLLCCITRGSKILIPRGGDQIQVGDNVIVVTLEHGLHDLRDIVEH